MQPNNCGLNSNMLNFFCYGCGKLGHVLVNSDLVTEVKDEANLQYGAWLHASPLKSRHRNVETELIEERKFYMAFKNKAQSSKPRVKLLFDNPAFLDTPREPPPLASEDFSHMSLIRMRSSNRAPRCSRENRRLPVWTRVRTVALS